MSNDLFFIDCEHNGFKGQLLSMALMPLDPKIEPFYVELEVVELLDTWVQRNVMPKMETEGINIRTMQHVLEKYMAPFPKMTIISDWPEDISYFNQALITSPGKAINTPILTFVMDRRIDVTSSIPHHALYDAKANRDFYMKCIMELMDGDNNKLSAQ